MSAPKRLSVGEDGLLRDRHGVVFGRLESLTIAWGVRGVKEESKTTTKEGGVGETTAAIDAVLAHYVAVMKPRSTMKFGEDDRRLVREALKVATVDELRRAIDGCSLSPFHMGQNDRRKKYTRLSHILKGKQGIRTTREQIEMFLEIADGAVTQAATGIPAWVRENLLLERDGDADNDEVRRRIEKAAAWLSDHGFRWHWDGRRLNIEGDK